MAQSYLFAPPYLRTMLYTPEIRFSDIDSYGIVHNAKFLIFFEQSRIALFNKISGDWDWKASGVLVANQEINYIVPVTLKDNLEILVWVEKVGTKSMTYSYEAYKTIGGKKVLAATSKTVLVSFDVASGKSIEVPELWRNTINENGLLGRPEYLI